MGSFSPALLCSRFSAFIMSLTYNQGQRARVSSGNCLAVKGAVSVKGGCWYSSVGVAAAASVASRLAGEYSEGSIQGLGSRETCFYDIDFSRTASEEYEAFLIIGFESTVFRMRYPSLSSSMLSLSYNLKCSSVPSRTSCHYLDYPSNCVNSRNDVLRIEARGMEEARLTTMGRESGGTC